MFMSYHHYNNKINFYDIENLTIEKILYNIDVKNDKNTFLLFKENYLIVSCKKGIKIISIKT